MLRSFFCRDRNLNKKKEMFYFRALFFGIIILYIFGIGSVNAVVSCKENQKTRLGELRKSLLCDYDKSVRPFIDETKPVIFKIHMNVLSHYFNEAQQRLTIFCWIALEWQDTNLKWDPKKWNGTAKMYVSSHDIWMPDISVHNSDYGKSFSDQKETNCQLKWFGKLLCVLPIDLTAYCRADYKKWPYDIQNCTMNIGSWTSSNDDIDFDNETLEVQTYERLLNKHWDLFEATVTYVPETYPEVPNQTFPMLYYNFKIARHSGVIEIVVFVPAISMIILNLIPLVLEVKNKNRLLFIALNIISHFLIIQQLSWECPKNGDTVPTVLVFFRDSLVITLIVLLETVMVQSIENSLIEAPRWIKNLLRKISDNTYTNLFFYHIPFVRRFDVELPDDRPILAMQGNQEDTIWTTLTRILDRLLFSILFLTYFVMFWALLPDGK